MFWYSLQALRISESRIISSKCPLSIIYTIPPVEVLIHQCESGDRVKKNWSSLCVPDRVLRVELESDRGYEEMERLLSSTFCPGIL